MIQVGVFCRGGFRVVVSGGGIIGITPVNNGEWRHVAAVWEYSYGPDVTDVKPYVDGVEEISTIGADVTIGVYPGSVRYFDGLIDDVRIYNRALDGGEIAALAGL